ncbi:PaaI family thioesterase [Aeromicrobium tamlense]|uniref:Acyl-CoA thioesterase n=1 Tax=Aeromicrobium tamlense TaxID=375541 RepID=A0A8I0KHM4_9ACTN|nr:MULTISPECIES: PaaI family thioesterase [Aeromicrobium]MBD1268897.1 PaaI family thioesterase [Aeromicrobium tamlense]NYI37196.1 acyl-CoA thioesterase [Aeromicrobium tamlense]
MTALPLTDDQLAAMSRMTGLEFLQFAFTLPRDQRPAVIGDLFGMQVLSLEEGKVSFSIQSLPTAANPLGTLHGGACATLLDSVMGCAVHTMLGPGVGYGTLELKVNYIRTVPVDGRTLTGTGSIIHVGRSTATAEGKVLDPDGKLVAHGTTTCMIYS